MIVKSEMVCVRDGMCKAGVFGELQGRQQVGPQHAEGGG